MKVWSWRDGRCLATLEGHTSWVNSVAWSGDGERVVSASWDGTSRVWDVATGRCLRVTWQFPEQGYAALDALALAQAETGCDETGRALTPEELAAARKRVVLYASPNAWRFLRWYRVDAETGRDIARRPLEAFGRVPGLEYEREEETA